MIKSLSLKCTMVGVLVVAGDNGGIEKDSISSNRVPSTETKSVMENVKTTVIL